VLKFKCQALENLKFGFAITFRENKLMVERNIRMGPVGPILQAQVYNQPTLDKPVTFLLFNVIIILYMMIMCNIIQPVLSNNLLINEYLFFSVIYFIVIRT
jgi:hypothetical protein